MDTKKEKKRKGSPLRIAITVVCALLIIGACVGGTYYVARNTGKNGKNGAPGEEQYTVKTETVREYVTEYLSSPDGSAQIKQLTQDDVKAFTDTISEYFNTQGVQTNTDLSTIEKELLEKLGSDLVEKLDWDEIERLIDLSVVAHLKDLQLGGTDSATDYSALIAELRAKYDAKISELTSMIESLQGNYEDLRSYVTNTTVSVTDVKALEETVNQLKTTLEQLSQQSTSLTNITNKFEQDFSILDARVTENYNNLLQQLEQTNTDITEMSAHFSEAINILEEKFGQQLTDTYTLLDQYIQNQALLSEQRDLTLQQNLEQTATDIRNELQLNVDQLTSYIDQNSQDIRNELEQTATDIRNELQLNVDTLNAKLSEEVLNLNNRISTEVTNINQRIQELKEYVEGYVNTEIQRLSDELEAERQARIAADDSETANRTAADNTERTERVDAINDQYDKMVNQYQWSKDASGQDKLTITTPAPR